MCYFLVQGKPSIRILGFFCASNKKGLRAELQNQLLDGGENHLEVADLSPQGHQQPLQVHFTCTSSISAGGRI
ncbi:hypothetical protein Y1Q_0004642 [Alligator mississippiensis]|uniref:Uncharacterized protein n=1 Tax=Alligator mississippiensis TaxID=8496 RepID=A0A151MHS5_ALLMI|nr:hypothetical protein Y1Q_0004642 [Alligator mississippiensis]